MQYSSIYRARDDRADLSAARQLLVPEHTQIWEMSAAWPDCSRMIRVRGADTMEVELEVEKVLDNELGIYIEKDFIITKVLKHTPRPIQSSIMDMLGSPEDETPTK